MAKQALTASGQIVLPENVDVFEGVKRAETARNILLQAQAEVQKTFPDFTFKFEAGNYRDPNAPRRGRKSAADAAAAAAAANTAAAATNGSGAPAGAKGAKEQPAA